MEKTLLVVQKQVQEQAAIIADLSRRVHKAEESDPFRTQFTHELTLLQKRMHAVETGNTTTKPSGGFKAVVRQAVVRTGSLERQIPPPLSRRRSSPPQVRPKLKIQLPSERVVALPFPLTPRRQGTLNRLEEATLQHQDRLHTLKSKLKQFALSKK